MPSNDCASMRSFASMRLVRYAGGSCVSARMSASSRRGLIGLAMYSTAPRLSAVTAVRTEPWPVMSTALVSGHASCSILMSEMPLRPGSCRSDSTRWNVSVRNRSSAASADNAIDAW